MTECKRKYTAVVSARRGEIYIYDLNDNLLFTIPPEEVVHGLEYCEGEALYREIETYYADILQDLGVL
jgi:hypothetical protein